MAEPSTQLFELLEAACNGNLSDSQFQQLQALLESDAEARTVYVRYMGLDADLWAGVYDSVPAVPKSAETVITNGEQSSSAWWKNPTAKLVLGFLAVGLLITASISVSAWFFRVDPNKPSPEVVQQPKAKPTPVAFVTRSVKAKWQNGTRKSGEILVVGESLHLLAGIGEITFTSGARVILQAPAILKIQSSESVKLESGRLVGRVPKGVTGFSVQTPSTTVVDLGTEFGVELDEKGTTDVIVFDGEVDVQRPPQEDPEMASALPESFLLYTGQSARIAMDQVVEDPKIDVKRFVRNEELTRLTNAVILEEDFSSDKLDPTRWKTLASAPKSAVRMTGGQLGLVNRGYLATTGEYDPLELGGIRITGKWRFVTPDNATGHRRVNIMTIILRGQAKARGKFFEASSGIFFKCYSNNRWASIGSIGPEITVTKRRALFGGKRKQGDYYQFEIIDDGKHLSFKFWDPEEPKHVAHSIASVIRDTSNSNHILFYCRESQPPDWTYKALLDDIVIETGVGPISEERNE